jgi:CSLREA domain-containing protein
LTSFAVLIAAVCCVLPVHAGTRCGLVDGFTDGSTDADTDGDGIADCLDDRPLLPGTPVAPQGDCVLVVDTFADGDDGECSVDCTLREALEVAQGANCTIELGPGTYEVNLGSLVLPESTSVVGSGAENTIIDAEISEPAIHYQYFGPFGTSAVLTGLTLEHDGSGIRHECGDCGLILNNCIVRGDPAGSAGSGLSILSGPIHFYSWTSLNNTIVRDAGGISLVGGGGTLWGDACLITENRGRGINLQGGGYSGASAGLTDCEISYNSGGGVRARGAVTGPSVGSPGSLSMTRGVIKGNGAGVDKGGGIYLDSGAFISGGRATLVDSTIEDNRASVAGGGVYVEGGTYPGSLTLDRSTLSGNTAPSGGGLFQEPGGCAGVLRESTVSGNRADSNGGGVYYGSGCPQLRSSTVAYNQAEFGGGVYAEAGVTFRPLNSILGANASSGGAGSGPDCFGTLDSVGYDLIGDLDGCTVLSEPTDLLGVAPDLAPLGDYGGPTWTHNLEPSSPAVNNGLLAGSCSETDQRGVPRPQGDSCDIGSVEVAPDSDGDGVPDVIDGCPDDPDKSDPGFCGCGVPETEDTDGDGLPDCADGCPNDPDKVDPGICGCGVPDEGDTDGDGILDCVDPCLKDPDLDHDGFSQAGDCPPGTPADCDDADPDTFPDAPEVNDGLDNQCPGDFGYGIIDETSGNSGFHNPADKHEYSWTHQEGALAYEVWRSQRSNCFGTPHTYIIDPEIPGLGEAPFFYLNHAESPHVGSWGRDSAGQERTYLSCP